MQNNYRTKTIAELEYIIKDAGEAARCMNRIGSIAEFKYLDQVNDACTELYARRSQQMQQIKSSKTVI